MSIKPTNFGVDLQSSGWGPFPSAHINPEKDLEKWLKNRPKPFEAKWTSANASLNPYAGNCLSNLIQRIKNYFLSFPNSFIAPYFNPITDSMYQDSSGINSGTKEAFYSKPIITPDKAHLKVLVHVIQKGTKDAPIALLFNGIKVKDEESDDLHIKLVEKGFNVVTVEHRSSSKTRRAEDLVLDGDSVYQFVTKELGVSPEKIHFYGFSLGGAIAARVKALHPECTGKYAGEEVRSSTYTLIKEKYCIKRWGRLVKKITSCASAIFLAYPLYLLGWEWNGRRAYEKLQGEKGMIYHENSSIPSAAKIIPSYEAKSSEAAALLGTFFQSQVPMSFKFLKAVIRTPDSDSDNDL